MGQKKYSLKQMLIFLAIVAAVGIPLEIMVINELFASSAARVERSQYDTEVSIQLTSEGFRQMDECLESYNQSVGCEVVRGSCLTWEIRKLEMLDDYDHPLHSRFQLCEDGRWVKSTFARKAEGIETVMMDWTRDFLDLKCIPSIPSTEVCDFHDNDCNGIIDDYFNLDSDPRNCGTCGAQCSNGQSCLNGRCLASRETR